MNGLINSLKKTCLLAFLLVLFAVSPVFGAETALSTGDISGAEQVGAEISYLEITPVSADVLIEDTVQLTAAAYDSEGQETSCTGLIWESSDETVGTVDSAGLFTALSPGTSTVTVFCGEFNSGCTITVSENESESESVTETESESESGNPDEESPEEESPENLSEVFPVEVSPSESELIIGDEQLFTASAFDESGSEVADADFTWMVNDETVGTVDSTGLFTALAEGTVTVTATAGDFSADAAVTVSGAEIPEATSEPTQEPTPEPTAEPKTITEVISSISAEESFGGVIPAVDDVYLKVANAEGAYYNCWGNQTYRIKWNGGGENSLHITNDSRGSEVTANYGQITYTNDLSGTFYVSTTGGRGYQDDVLLMVAVNGTIPNDFRLRIHADGYQWIPNSTPHKPPALQDIVYDEATVDEWFDKDDLIYGPQTWRPAVNIQYPIFPYQDVSDTSNKFSIMLVDLNGGVLTEETLRIRYEAENLNTMLAFNVYGYARNVLGSSMYDVIYNTTEWTNRLTSTGHWSGWYVSGAPLPDAATVTISPSTADVPLNGKKEFTATAYDSKGSVISGAPIAWSSSDTGVGTIDDGLFTPKAIGTTKIFATSNNASANATVTVSDAVEKKLSEIKLSPDSYSEYVDLAENVSFSAIGYDQFGDNISGLSFTWSSSNADVGTIDQTGLLTIKGAGNTTVSAKCDNISGDAEVNINLRKDWSIPLEGAINYTLDRSMFIGFESVSPADFTDQKNDNWEGVNLSKIVGLVDDHDPLTFNESFAERDYNITIYGKANGESKEIVIKSRELVDSNSSFILANKLNGVELPDSVSSGRLYWPLKLTGSGILYSRRQVEEISSVILELPPDVRKINITPESLTILDTGRPFQFTGEAFNGRGEVIPYVPFTWTCTNKSVGTIDQNGYFTPKSPGITYVDAGFYNVNETAKVTVLGSSPSQMTFYVDQSGGGDFKTIQAAVDFSRDGDIVVVRDGEYTENIVLDYPVTLTSENGAMATTIIPEDSVTAIQVNSANSHISGFMITGCTGSTISVSGSSNVIEDVNLTSSGNGLSLTSVSSNTVFRNSMIESGAYGIFNAGSGNSIVGNHIVASGRYGISLDASTGSYVSGNNISALVYNSGCGIFLRWGSDSIIEENDIYGKRYGILTGDDNVSICNNYIVAQNSYPLDISGFDEEITVVGNTLIGEKAYAIYVRENTVPGSIYLNDVQAPDGSRYIYFYRNSLSFPLNSTKKVTYSYNNQTFTDFIGNNFNIYTGLDLNGDGLGETPFVSGGLSNYHPLIDDIGSYKILELTEEDPRDLNSTLNFKGLGVKAGAGGKQTATVNTTLTETTHNGNNVTISRANYDLVIEYDSDMAVTGDQITGTVKSVQLKTENLQKCNCSTGNVSGSLVVNLNDIPDGSAVDSSLMDGATAEQNAAFQLAASGDGLKVDAVACTLTVVRQNLANGNDVASATIRLSADRAWVDAHGGNESIKIIRCAEDGTKEILDTKSIAFDGVMETFEAVSPNGLSVFGLSATSTASTPSAGSSTGSSSSGGGGSSSIGTSRVDSIGAGETGVFTLGETAITSVEVVATAEIPEMMLTSEKVSVPSGIDAAPGDVYQYIEIEEYLASEGSMKMATLKFSVDKDWLSSIGSLPSGVKVYRYDEESETWELLSTVENGETDSGYRFFADTPSFSLFAITAEKGASSSVSSGITPGDSEPDSGISSGPQTNVEQTVQTEAPANASGLSSVFLLIAVFAIIGVCVVVYRFKKAEKK